MIFRIILLFFLLFAAGALSQVTSPTSPSTNSIQNPTITPADQKEMRQKATVVRVIDGDTIEVEFVTGGKAGVRYIGIDTPETVDPRKEIGCFGKEATAKNRELVEGKEVELEKDVSETDTFGRLLRYVYVGDPETSSGRQIFVNEYLVKQGYASVSTFPPDVRYQERFISAQKEAQEQSRGLWLACR